MMKTGRKTSPDQRGRFLRPARRIGLILSIAVGISPLLAGCGDVRTRLVCPAIVEWPADLQKKAAAEILSHPDLVATPELLILSARQRDELRECAQR